MSDEMYGDDPEIVQIRFGTNDRDWWPVDDMSSVQIVSNVFDSIVEFRIVLKGYK
jgi:hypothetical protein